MNMKCPRCPMCDSRPSPALPISAKQAFCDNLDCSAICWNPSVTLDENLLNTKSVPIRLAGGDA